MLPRRENGTRLEGILTSCVSHPCILTESCYYPSLQVEGHAARSTFLASSSSSSSSSSFSFSSSSLSSPLSSSSFPPLYYLKATYVRRKSFILNLTICSRSCVDVEERMKRRGEYGRTGGRRICGNRARNSVRKHDDCITSNVPFQRAIKHAYKTLLTLYSARSFPIATIVSTKFYRGQWFPRNNC